MALVSASAAAAAPAHRVLIAFSLLYGMAYVTLLPPDLSLFLPLGPARNLELVTHARYARHLFELGTPHNLELAPFGFRRSPAASFLIAWQSVLFGRDALAAAVPALCGVAAAFGLAAITLLRVAGSTPPVALAIACALVSGPLSRWLLAAYGLPELLAATAILAAVAGVAGTSGGRRAPAAAAVCAGCVVVLFAEGFSVERASAGVQAALRVISTVPPHLWLGWPARIARVRSAEAIDGAFIVLPMAAVIWAAVTALVIRARVADRLAGSEEDRRLAGALALHAIAALAFSNIALDVVRDPRPARLTAGWRQMEELNRLPFGGLTLKMDDISSVSTALALYGLPVKRAIVVGPEVQDADLEFEAVSAQLPLFIQGFGCPGAGHDNTYAVADVGCLMLAPPSPTLGTRYAFAQRFPFLSYEGLSARTPQGRFNTRETLPLKVMVDPQRAKLDGLVYFNLFVDPRVPEGGGPHKLSLRWGGEHRGQLALDRPAWFSLPLRPQDWSGNRIWTTVVNIDFLDRTPTLFQQLSLTETPEGKVVDGR